MSQVSLFLIGICPDGFTSYNCLHQKLYNISYTYGCSMPNWFSSEYACRKLGGHLVIFHNTTQLQTVFDFLIKRTDKKPPCDNYWIGFAKSVWLFSNISSISNGMGLMLPTHFYYVTDDIQLYMYYDILNKFSQNTAGTL